MVGTISSGLLHFIINRLLFKNQVTSLTTVSFKCTSDFQNHCQIVNSERRRVVSKTVRAGHMMCIDSELQYIGPGDYISEWSEKNNEDYKSEHENIHKLGRNQESRIFRPRTQGTQSRSSLNVSHGLVTVICQSSNLQFEGHLWTPQTRACS